jgi:Rieske Fe-S protein
MTRRNFTQQVCALCVGGSSLSSLLSACQSAFYTTGTMEKNGISVLRSDFTYLKDDKMLTRSYVIVRNDALQYPIYLYRFSDNEFSALLMKCTHQGTELQAAGDQLHCPAHGSEFSNRGMATQGPAENALRSFKVSIEADKIFIYLT